MRYRYDPLGRIATRAVDGEVTRYVYDGFQLLAQLGPDGRERFFVHGPGVDQPLAVWDDGRWVYLHANALGTVLAYTDADGERIATAAFDPFGVVQEAPADLPLFYAGRLVDREAQLVHMRARFYAPELGQFLTPDPSLLEGGENAYVYVENQPLDMRDPLGLDGEQKQGFFSGLARRGRATISSGTQGLRSLANSVQRTYRSARRTLHRARANPLRTLEEGMNRARRATSDAMDVEKRYRDQLRGFLLRSGYINPPGHTPPYTSTLRNFLQPALDHTFEVMHDANTGLHAIGKDVINDGVTAFDDEDSAVGNAVSGYYRAALNYGRMVEAEKEHYDHLYKLFRDAGYDHYDAQFRARAQWYRELFRVTKLEHEVIGGYDYDEYVKSGNLKNLDGWTRARKGFEILLEIALTLTGNRVRAPKKLPTTKAPVTAPPRAPSATQPQRKGMVQALGGDTAGARTRGPGANAPRAPPKGAKPKGAKPKGAKPKKPVDPDHLEPDCVFVRGADGKLQRIGNFLEDPKAVLDYLRKHPNLDHVVVSNLKEARALKKVLRNLTGKKPNIFGGSSKRAAKNNRAAHEAREAAKAREAARARAKATPSEAKYVRAPKELSAFPDANPVKPKSSVKGGGKRRRRWVDKKGNIYEWDYQHGRVEKYSKQGKHLGEFDPTTGNRTKPANPSRSTPKQ